MFICLVIISVSLLINKGLLPAMKLGSLKIRVKTIEDFLEKYDGMDLSDLDNIIYLNKDFEPTNHRFYLTLLRTGGRHCRLLKSVTKMLFNNKCFFF